MVLKTNRNNLFAKINWTLQFILNHIKMLSRFSEWFNTLHSHNLGLFLSNIDIGKLFSNMQLKICGLFDLKAKAVFHKHLFYYITCVSKTVPQPYNWNLM